MKQLTLLCLSLGLALNANTALARDTTHHLPFQAAMEAATASGKLDGSVKFLWAKSGKGQVLSEVTTSKKTNAFNKTDEEACDWALQSALIALQTAAKRAGANAVTEIVSNYQHVEYKDAQKYECHAGALMAGVALKAKLVKQ